MRPRIPVQMVCTAIAVKRRPIIFERMTRIVSPNIFLMNVEKTRISQIQTRARRIAINVIRSPSCAPRIMTVVMAPGPHIIGVPMITPAMAFFPTR